MKFLETKNVVTKSTYKKILITIVEKSMSELVLFIGILLVLIVFLITIKLIAKKEDAYGLQATANKPVKKINTNHFQTQHYDPKYSEDLQKNFQIKGMDDSTYLNFIKQMDNVYNDFTLNQLKFVESIAQEGHIKELISQLIKLKERENEFFHKNPHLKPYNYRM